MRAPLSFPCAHFLTFAPHSRNNDRRGHHHTPRLMAQRMRRICALRLHCVMGSTHGGLPHAAILPFPCAQGRDQGRSGTPRVFPLCGRGRRRWHGRTRVIEPPVHGEQADSFPPLRPPYHMRDLTISSRPPPPPALHARRGGPLCRAARLRLPKHRGVHRRRSSCAWRCVQG